MSGDASRGAPHRFLGRRGHCAGERVDDRIASAVSKVRRMVARVVKRLFDNVPALERIVGGFEKPVGERLDAGGHGAALLTGALSRDPGEPYSRAQYPASAAREPDAPGQPGPHGRVEVRCPAP
jgi:hypothetical protein